MADKPQTTPPPIAKEHGFTNLVFHHDGNEGRAMNDKPASDDTTAEAIDDDKWKSRAIAAADEIERLREALIQISSWSDAYPTDIFPEPDQEYYHRAHEVLTASGMTLDRLSAAAMRHVAVGMGAIAKKALEEEVLIA